MFRKPCAIKLYRQRCYETMIALVNPQATSWRYRIPLSVLSIGASIEGHYPYEIIDGNVDRKLSETLPKLIEEKKIKYIGLTVMPGPQLHQSIKLSKMLRNRFPSLKIIWGGYFPTLHKTVVVNSGYVDYVIRDQGDYTFKQLIDVLEHGGSLASIAGLTYCNGTVHHNQRQELIDPNELPPLPYHKVKLAPYVSPTFLGTRTVNYHSSVGCPFLCGFCAVAAVYKARWIGLTPERIVTDLLWFKQHYNVNAIEFADNNFFTSEKRTHEFSERMVGRDITWWGEGRPDTLLNYNDRTWQLMKRSGCKMIFFGAESSSQKILDMMDKGGTQTPDTVIELASKARAIGIVPEFSFVLGSPSDVVDEDLEKDIEYIKKIKRINPQSEIIIYVYSPVFFEDAELFEMAKSHGFSYPTSLDDWLEPQWLNHDLRKTPVTPWLKAKHLRRIKNFERVLNACFPTNSDLKLHNIHRRIMKFLGYWRYQLSVYNAPYEVAAIQRYFRYRQPEIEGF
ncbi:MAG: B12-binding domain-containing radical SAM protein [Ignavibacteria bacterium]|nr:B12-binding domain-containing radical SAM protein [Ignavibacteria bacterium]